MTYFLHFQTIAGVLVCCFCCFVGFVIAWDKAIIGHAGHVCDVISQYCSGWCNVGFVTKGEVDLVPKGHVEWSCMWTLCRWCNIVMLGVMVAAAAALGEEL